MKIYTKTGDTGETALFDGTRVPKSDPRVEAYGDVDELKRGSASCARAAASTRTSTRCCRSIQHDLFAIGALLADPGHRIAPRVAKGDARRRRRVAARELDRHGSTARCRRCGTSCWRAARRPAALLHLARAVCRRAERRIVALGPDAVDPVLLVYINRLSDLLFVMARSVNARAGVADQAW